MDRSISLSLLSGLLLLTLLPIGIFSPISGVVFLVVFLLHLALHSVSLFSALSGVARQFSQGSLRALFLLFLLVVVGLVGAHSFLPPTARDALIHHLAVPKWWVEADSIVPISWHDWSYYPMLLQLAFTGFFSLGLVEWVALYHYSFALLLAALVSHLLYKKTECEGLSLFGFCSVLLLPLVIKLGASQLVDLGLAYFAFLAFLLALRWVEQPRYRDLLMCGVALGLCMGVKYNGFLFAALFLLLFLFLGARSGRSTVTVIFTGVAIGVVALLTVSAWLIKNGYYTGNPFYPLMGGYFETADPIPGVRGFKSLEFRYLRYDEGLLDFFLLPFRMIIWGEDNNPRWFDGRLSPMLLFLLVPLWEIRKKPWIAFSFLLLVTYTYVGLLSSGPRVRYLLPLLGIAIVLAVYGLHIILRACSPILKRRLLVFLFLFQFLWAGYYLTAFLEESELFTYLTSKETKEDYFESHVSEYRFAKYVNEHVSSNNLLYLIYTGNRFYYYDVPVRSGGHYATSDIIRWLHRSPDVETFLKQFQLRGITHLGVHVPRLRENLKNVLPPREAQLWDSFQRASLNLTYYHGPFTLWKLSDGGD